MKQITIVADDKVGLLADISYILGKARVNIEAITVDVHGGKAVIILSVKDEAKAAKMLAASGYKIMEEEVLVVKVKDEPGELSKISERLKKEGINILNLYIISRENGYSLDVLKVDKPKKAKAVLADCLVKGC
ncbi:MAG: ACT domain-containing protein [Candidatus Micrarchaeota archaeon]|nr:ACT domain-containing protein [Candidatus Micrarchaeota archaeon]